MTPRLDPSEVPTSEPSATSPSETAELEEPFAGDVPGDAPEQTRKISTIAIVTGALAFATAMGAGIYYYLKKTHALEEPDV